MSSIVILKSSPDLTSWVELTITTSILILRIWIICFNHSLICWCSGPWWWGGRDHRHDHQRRHREELQGGGRGQRRGQERGRRGAEEEEGESGEEAAEPHAPGQLRGGPHRQTSGQAAHKVCKNPIWNQKPT